MAKVEGNRIRTILEKQGRPSSWLARELGMSANMVSLYCLNKSQPSLENAYRIANVLGVQMEDLVDVRK